MFSNLIALVYLVKDVVTTVGSYWPSNNNNDYNNMNQNQRHHEDIQFSKMGDKFYEMNQQLINLLINQRRNDDMHFSMLNDKLHDANDQLSNQSLILQLLLMVILFGMLVAFFLAVVVISIIVIYCGWKIIRWLYVRSISQRNAVGYLVHQQHGNGLQNRQRHYIEDVQFDPDRDLAIKLQEKELTNSIHRHDHNCDGDETHLNMRQPHYTEDVFFDKDQELAMKLQERELINSIHKRKDNHDQTYLNMKGDRSKNQRPNARPNDFDPKEIKEAIKRSLEDQGYNIAKKMQKEAYSMFDRQPDDDIDCRTDLVDANFKELSNKFRKYEASGRYMKNKNITNNLNRSPCDDEDFIYLDQFSDNIYIPADDSVKLHEKEDVGENRHSRYEECEGMLSVARSFLDVEDQQRNLERDEISTVECDNYKKTEDVHSNRRHNRWEGIYKKTN